MILTPYTNTFTQASSRYSSRFSFQPIPICFATCPFLIFNQILNNSIRRSTYTHTHKHKTHLYLTFNSSIYQETLLQIMLLTPSLRTIFFGLPSASSYRFRPMTMIANIHRLFLVTLICFHVFISRHVARAALPAIIKIGKLIIILYSCFCVIKLYTNVQY